MRNLKRVLSLALAVVMVIGMMVMTTGAADFDDAAEIKYAEAVDVLSALEVLEGYDGIFNPNGKLTRDQGAAIIARMMLGKAGADKLPGTGKFADTTGWSAGVVEYCANLGIISGWNGNFAPGDDLLAVQFGKMLLCALGYNAEIEGYNGDNWVNAIALDMMAVGLDIEGVDLYSTLTREQAAQMALIAIRSPMVEYDSIASYFGVSKVEYVTTTLAKEQRISKQQLTNSKDYTVEFGEKYFPTLSLVDTYDAMARPAHEWLLKNESLGLYTEVADYEGYLYAGEDEKVEDLFELVDSFSKRLDDSKADIFVNGQKDDVSNKNARGNYVQVYMNAEDATLVDRICVTHNTVAEITGIKTVVSGEKTYVVIGGLATKRIDKVVGWEEIDDTVIMYHVDNAGVWHLIDPVDFAATMTAGTDEEGKDAAEEPKFFHIGGEVYEVSEQTASKTSLQLIAHKGKTTGHYWLDGAGYVIWGTSARAAADPINLMMVLKNNQYYEGNVFEGNTIESQVLFVDATGATKIVDIAEIDDNPAGYYFVDENDPATPNNPNDDTKKFGAPIELDDKALEPVQNEQGKTFVINENKDAAVLYKYNTDDNGAYVLEKVTTTDIKATTSIIKGIPSAFEGEYTDVIITDSKTVYLVRDYDTKKAEYKDTYTVYTGFANVPSLKVEKNCAEIYGTGTAEYVVINEWTAIDPPAVAAADLFYVLDSEITAHYKDGKVDYFTVSALMDGEKTTLKIANGADVETIANNTIEVELATNPLKSYTLYMVTKYDDKGNVDTMAEAITSTYANSGTLFWVNMYGSQAAKNDKIVLDTAKNELPYATSFAYAEDCVVYTISGEDDVVVVGTIADLTTDANDKISMVVAGSKYGTVANNTAVEIYVRDIADPDEEIEDEDEEESDEPVIGTVDVAASTAREIAAELSEYITADGAKAIAAAQADTVFTFDGDTLYLTGELKADATLNALYGANDANKYHYVSFFVEAPAELEDATDVTIECDGKTTSTTVDDGRFHLVIRLENYPGTYEITDKLTWKNADGDTVESTLVIDFWDLTLNS